MISTSTFQRLYLPNSSVKDYIMLMKPRVMSLVVFTSFCGLMLAKGHIHPFIGLTAILCIAGGAGSAAAINMWYDRDIDAIMERTKKRPIIVQSIAADEALSFGIVLGFFAVLLMILCINLLSGLLLAITILYYIFIYTIWLKRSSPQNVVIGGVAGALPPMIGSACVTGNISLESFILFMIIFMWTPPHSWALALYRAADYKNCQIPMMPVIKGDYYTKQQILIYSILMFLTSLIPFFLAMGTVIYLVIASSLGLIFLGFAFALFKDVNNKIAKKMFIYSIFYLFTIFFSLLIENLR